MKVTGKSHIVKVVCLFAALVASISHAELKFIDDEALSSVTGRAGITIDIDMGVEIGEFMYKDAGSLVMQGVRVGGMDRTVGGVGTLFDGATGIVADNLDPTGISAYGGTTGLNNVRIEVDIAGDGSTNGKLLVPATPPFVPNDIFLADNQFSWAWGEYTQLGQGGNFGCGDNGKCLIDLNDGDLFIHASPSDSTASDNNTALTIADFGMEMDVFALKASSYVAGDDIVNRSGTAGTAQSTTIMSDLKIEGYFGGFDLLV